MQIPFATQFASGRSPVVNSELMVNLFPEVNPRGKSQVALYRCPGLKPFANPGGSQVRGLFSIGSLGYAVIDDTLYEVSSTGATTQRGTLSTSTGRVGLSWNGTQGIIVDGSNGYVYEGGALSRITDTDFLGSDSAEYLDGFSLFIQPGGQRIYSSELKDASTLDALDFASAESSPDSAIAQIVDHREWWIFGANSTEIWQNQGAAGFPFGRFTTLERGIASPYACTKEDNTVFWLGDDGVVYRAEQYSPLRVSSEAVEYAISQEDISQCAAFAQTEQGHKFIFFQFPSRTLVYDIATNWWHERRNYPSGAWRGNCMAKIGNKWIVGDRTSGKLFELSESYFQDDDGIQRWEAISPNINRDQKRLFHRRFELALETGIGLETGQGADPQVFLSWSDDGGRTYSDAIWASVGVQGDYQKRVAWWQLGQSGYQGRYYRVAGTDPVITTIAGAYGAITVGQS